MIFNESPCSRSREQILPPRGFYAPTPFAMKQFASCICVRNLPLLSGPDLLRNALASINSADMHTINHSLNDLRDKTSRRMCSVTSFNSYGKGFFLADAVGGKAIRW